MPKPRSSQQQRVVEWSTHDSLLEDVARLETSIYDAIEMLEPKEHGEIPVRVRAAIRVLKAAVEEA